MRPTVGSARPTPNGAWQRLQVGRPLPSGNGRPKADDGDDDEHSQGEVWIRTHVPVPIPFRCEGLIGDDDDDEHWDLEQST